MFNHQTISMMSLLKHCFKSIHIIKPLTSRPANSEKYLMCCGYKVTKGRDQIAFLKDIIMRRAASPRKRDVYKQTDLSLLQQIVHYNIYYTSRQVYYIQKTIDLINSFDATQPSLRHKRFDDTLMTNFKKCQKWCQKYEIPYAIK